MEAAVSYVLQSLDESFTLAQAAARGCYSPVHFQALFAEYMGETFAEYLLRNRLYLAAKRLTETHTRLPEIATLSGFSSQANFSRAFGRWFGSSPARFRHDFFGSPVPVGQQAGRRRRSNLEPELELFTAKTFLTCTAQGYMSSRFEHTLWDAMARLCHNVSGLSGRVGFADEPMYLTGGVLDLTQLDQGVKLAAVEVLSGKVPELPDCASVEFSGGPYATFVHQGVLPEQTLNIALFDWLPASDYCLDPARPVVMQAQQLSMSDLLPALSSRVLRNSQCVLSDGLGLSARRLGEFEVKLSVPLIVR
jgi:AraC-like DNA-binding protein